MTVRKEHIEALESLRTELSTVYQDAAIDVAIALMRAAEPKDPQAEREHCDALADKMTAEWLEDDRASDALLNERADARAEVACLQQQLTEARAALKKQGRYEALLEAARYTLAVLQSMPGSDCTAAHAAARSRLTNALTALEDE